MKKYLTKRSKILITATTLICFIVVFFANIMHPMQIVYHVGDHVTGNWVFIGYVGGDQVNACFNTYTNGHNTGNVAYVTVYGESTDETLLLDNKTFAVIDWYAPDSWHGSNPSTITLRLMEGQ